MVVDSLIAGVCADPEAETGCPYPPYENSQNYRVS